MKKLLVIIILFFLCGIAFSQTTPIYTPVQPTIYGQQQLRFKAWLAQHIPEKTDTLTNTNDTTSQIFLLKADSSVWAYYKPRGFFQIGSGSGGGGFALDSIYVFGLIDTNMTLHPGHVSIFVEPKILDSLKHQYIDTGSVIHDGYCLQFDSTNRKWILGPCGNGGGGGLDSLQAVFDVSHSYSYLTKDDTVQTQGNALVFTTNAFTTSLYTAEFLNTGGGYGLHVNGFAGIAAEGSSIGGIFQSDIFPFESVKTSSSTNSVSNVGRFVNSTSGVGLNGVGANIDIENSTSTGPQSISNSIVSKFTNATTGALQSEFSIIGRKANALPTIFSIDGTNAYLPNMSDTLATRAYARSLSGGTSGTVTSIAKGYGLVTDGTITITGTITVDTTSISSQTRLHNDSLTLAAAINNKFSRSGDSASYVNLPNQTIATVSPVSGVKEFDSSGRLSVRTSLNKTYSISTSLIPTNGSVIDSLPNESGIFLMKQDSSTFSTAYQSGLKQNKFIINVNDYGVIGDSSTNNTTALRTVFSMASANKAWVYFPAGYYIISDTINIPFSCKITGNGGLRPYTGTTGASPVGVYARGSSVIIQTSATKSAFVVNEDGTEISGLSFSCTATTPSAGAGVRVVKGNSFRMNNTFIGTFYNNLEILSGVDFDVWGSQFYNPINYNMYVVGLIPDEGCNSIYSNTFNSSLSPTATQLRVETPAGIRIVDNEFHIATGQAVTPANYPIGAIDIFATGSTGEPFIIGNGIEAYTQFGIKIRLANSSLTLGRVVISQNQLSSYSTTTYPYDINIVGPTLPAAINYLTISGNTIINLKRAMYLESVANINMYGNNISNEALRDSLVNCTGVTFKAKGQAILDTVVVNNNISISRSGLGVTLSDGLKIVNTSLAAIGAQQITPSLHFQSNGFGTTAGTSQSTDWFMFNNPVQGTTPTSELRFQWGLGIPTINAMILSAAGQLTIPTLLVNTGGITLLKSAIGASQSDGLLNENLQAAVVGTQVQQSPSIHLLGNAWDGSASKVADVRMELVPVAGASPITSYLRFTSQINAGGYTDIFRIANTGKVTTYGMLTATGNPTIVMHQTDSTLTQLSGTPSQVLHGNGTFKDTTAVVGTSKYLHTIFTPTTGQTITTINNQYNIVNPAGTLLALTINLPSSPSNNDVVYIKFTQTITTVTYANGTVVDGITGPAAGGVVILVYDSGTTSWY